MTRSISNNESANSRDLILITVSGEDQPGLTAQISALLGEANVTILDVGQAVIHSYLTLGILVQVPDAVESLFKEVLFKTHEMGLAVKFTPVSHESYEQWVGLQGRGRHILTLLARKIKADHLAKVAEVIAHNGLNIDNITRLSGRVPLEQVNSIPANGETSGSAASTSTSGNNSKACVEFSLRGDPLSASAFRAELMVVSAELNIDVAVQEDSIYRRNRRLVAFDMDSTLIDAEVIDELAIEAGSGEQVKAITESAMRGEIDFGESLKRRVLTLKGLDVGVLETVAARLPLMEGAEALFLVLRQLGYKTAIISGGFTYFGQTLKEKLGVDHMFANQLEVREGRLTGQVIAPIVDAERKAFLLHQLADTEGIDMQQVIAVGDGANDLAMLNAAGLGIAFHAKPLVKESAEQSISNLGLDSILYLMGIRDRDASHLKGFYMDSEAKS